MSHDQEQGVGDHVAILVDELDDIDPATIRTQVMNLTTAGPPPVFDEEPIPGELTLPIVAVVASAVLVIGVILISVLTFSSRIRSVQESVSSFLSGEGLVLAEFRRETEVRLAEKDRAIMATLERLSFLEQERSDLDQLVETRVRQREQEIVAQVEQELEAERNRLQISGLDADAISAQIQEYRDGVALETAMELRAFQIGVEQEIRDRAAELQTAEADARTALELATVERSVLLDDAAASIRELSRSESETLRSIDQARNALAVPAGTPANPTTGGTTGDPALLLQISDLQDDAVGLRAEIAGLGIELQTADQTEITMHTEIVGLEARVQSLESSFESDDASETASRLAGLQALNAELANQLGVETSRANEAVVDLIAVEGELAAQRSAVAELNLRIASLEASINAAQDASSDVEGRLGTVAVQARTQALRDIVEAVAAYEIEGEAPDFTRLLALIAPDQLVARQLSDELATLVAGAQRAVLDAQLEYRPLGTVALTGEGSITVQRLVTLAISEGMLAEVRRTLSSGETEVIVRGTVRDVEEQRFTVMISETIPGREPAVSDRVFVAVPR